MICSVDPGQKKSAMLIFDPRKQEIDSMGIYRNAELLRMLRLGTQRVTVFAIELIASFGFTVGHEVFETCLWIGRFIEAAEQNQERSTLYPCYPCYRRQVLSHFRATNDATIRAAMRARFGENAAGCKYDLWSALAIAAYTADKIATGAEPQPLFKVVREVKVT